MRFFSYDGVLAQTIRYLWNMLVLNFCFSVCCLGVLTIGPAVSALYGVIMGADTDSALIKPFFRAFRNNFRQAAKAWLLFLAIAALLGADIYFLLSYSFVLDGVFSVLIVIVSVLVLSVFSFVFPMIARYENTLGQILKNSFALGIGCMPLGIIMSAVTFLPVILFFVDVNILTIVLLLWMPFGAVLTAQINGKILRHIFNKIEQSKSDT